MIADKQTLASMLPLPKSMRPFQTQICPTLSPNSQTPTPPQRHKSSLDRSNCPPLRFYKPPVVMPRRRRLIDRVSRPRISPVCFSRFVIFALLFAFALAKNASSSSSFPCKIAMAGKAENNAGASAANFITSLLVCLCCSTLKFVLSDRRRDDGDDDDAEHFTSLLLLEDDVAVVLGRRRQRTRETYSRAQTSFFFLSPLPLRLLLLTCP